MITTKEAKQTLFNNISLLGDESVDLLKAANRILVENVYSPLSHPQFDQTAVDGYAFRFADLQNIDGLKVIGEIPAGASPDIQLKENDAVRIFTGAPVPPDADTVVMQEYAKLDNGRIHVLDERLKEGANIRSKGEQIQKDEIALAKGTKLNSASIGFLTSLGFKSVTVTKLPQIGMVVTGNEFVDDIKDLEPGKIFEANGIMMQTAMKELGINMKVQICKDDPDALEQVLKAVAIKNDITIVTGGVSVGKYDYTHDMLQEIGFKTIFHKVSQKPGKPLLFAKKNDKAAFGLPGNPRAVMVCFYEYVMPYIKAATGQTNPFLPVTFLPLAHDYEKKGDRSFFLAGKFKDIGVTVLEKQGSHMLQTLSLADCLVVLPEGNRTYLEGEQVEVHLLPII